MGRHKKHAGGNSKCHVKFRGKWVTKKERSRLKRKSKKKH